MKCRILITIIAMTILAMLTAPSKGAAQSGASCYSSLLSAAPPTSCLGPEHQ